VTIFQVTIFQVTIFQVTIFQVTIFQVTIFQDTISHSILVVAIDEAIDLAIVMAIQAVVFLKAVVIDISCWVTVRVRCQVSTAARFAVAFTNPEAWMMHLAELFPLPT